MAKPIKIRNLPKQNVDKINKMAKENGLSRNEFLKRAIIKLVEDEEISRVNNLFEELIIKNLQVLDLNTKVLGEFCEENLIDISKFIM